MLAPIIEHSRAWLKNALTDRKLLPSINELQLWKCLEHDQKIAKMRDEIEELKEIIKQQQKLLEAQAEELKNNNSGTVVETAQKKNSFLDIFRK